MFSIKAAAITFIAALEQVSGMKIAILDRIEDPSTFWARTAVILCNKTGDSFCAGQMTFMTAFTEPSGFSDLISYTNAAGEKKQVCAILPPIDTIDPSYVAEAFTGTVTVEKEYPTSLSTSAWLYLYQAAHCLDGMYGGNTENRAAAFATLGLSILQGDPLFAPGDQTGQSRRIATMIKNNAAWWAAGAGERLLFEEFKTETASVLQNTYHCNATVLKATSIDTTNIQRDTSLTSGQDCAPNGGTQNPGLVTDANLWIWMYGNGGIGGPPEPYVPAKMFTDMNSAASYVLSTANKLAQ